MPAFICTTCGTQYPPSEAPPAQCVICEEERQYVPPSGQSWIAPERLAARHANTFRQHEPGLISIGSLPTFAIGQRALLVCTPAGNVLWDCISLLDDASVAVIKGLGGLKAIAISHPHFYTTMVDWSRAFDCPVHLHGADRTWVMRPDPAIQFWQGDTHRLWDGVTLVRALREMPQYDDVALLVLSTETGADLKAKGREAGATGWMAKPFDPEKMVEIVRQFVS